MDYPSVLSYLYSSLPMFHRVGSAAYKSGLGNIEALCAEWGHPEKDLRCIHIAGTNGKGSTSNLLASIFAEAGYTTGLFTSPHLKDFRERIRVNGLMISEEEVCEFITEGKERFESISPSFFELTALMAFDHFKRSKCDICIIETGLGGRLDSTNVIHPIVSLITNIGWDHMNLLGNTLELIAKEKAGIIKPGVPVIVGSRETETEGVFIAKARECESNLTFAGDLFQVRVSNWQADDAYLLASVFSGPQCILEKLECGLNGPYQTANITLAIAAAMELKKEFNLNERAIRSGFKNVRKNTGFRGRWDILGRNPLILADAAHNVHGLEKVLKALNKIPRKSLRMVIGLVNDKDIRSILSLLPAEARFYFCKADIPRGLDQNELKTQAASFGLLGSSYGSVACALEAAKSDSQANDLIFVGGSTFVVAEALPE